jgi:[acyl-carrier-protein] S-malonyltransferase
MKSAVVICPGRGTYNKAELGYLGRHFPDSDLLARFDAARVAHGQEPVRASTVRRISVPLSIHAATTPRR